MINRVTLASAPEGLDSGRAPSYWRVAYLGPRKKNNYPILLVFRPVSRVAPSGKYSNIHRSACLGYGPKPGAILGYLFISEALTAIKDSKRKVGRPKTYDPKYVDMARVACADLGADDIRLAKLFGITSEIIRVWKKQYPEFSASLKEGKDLYDCAVVEKNLLRRANGYKCIEVTEEPDKNGEIATFYHPTFAEGITLEPILAVSRRQDLLWKTVYGERHRVSQDGHLP
jgi:hypothetical protein